VFLHGVQYKQNFVALLDVYISCGAKTMKLNIHIYIINERKNRTNLSAQTFESLHIILGLVTCTLRTTKIKRLKFSKSHTGSDVRVQLAS
jgi:hypothetical protein